MILSFCRSFVGMRPLRTRWSAHIVAALLFCLVAAPGAQALEALDGRVQAHGFFEMQLRTLSRNYTDNWDLAQWYNIFNVELEVDLLQDTVGPLDLVSGYVRVEARFDCVYSRGCGMIKPANTYGDRSKSLPTRIMRGEIYDSAGQIIVGKDSNVARNDRDPLLLQETPGFKGLWGDDAEDAQGPGELRRPDLMQCRFSPCDASAAKFKPWGAPVQFWRADRNNKWASTSGVPWEVMDDGTDGNPFLVAMEAYRDFKFAAMPVEGGSNTGNPLALMGPWLPENRVVPNAVMANVANPLDSSRVSPASLSEGAGANPLRPIPLYREDDPERSKIYVRDLRPFTADNPERDVFGVPLNRNDTLYPDEFGWLTVNPLEDDYRTWNDRQAVGNEARGLFMPSAPLRAALDEGHLDTYNFNFNEQQRAFNRGASQQDEGELKEAYLDIEMFDSRLWMRVGKQTIVWGKTELFRTTDQFNPQDFALANLPSLEESRIALWAWRGVWSFYEVGPLSDVRAEVAFNFDEFESADLGACGEPYTINLVCSLTFGSMAHGFTGIGVVGQEQPPDPWDSIKGWEVGGRLEFRWDRYSFAITDFYGYDDFPHVKRLSTYNRNVDWRSGRPRHYMHREQDLALSYDGTVGQGCSTPQGEGMPTYPLDHVSVLPDGSDTGGSIDFRKNPDGTVTTVPTYVGFNGAENAGCLTFAASNRSVDASGKPFRVPQPTLRPGEGGGITNPYERYTGQFWNDTSRSDPNDPRPDCFKDSDGGQNITAECLALADYDPRYDPNNEIATDYGTYQGRMDMRFFTNPRDREWLNAYDPTLVYDPRNALEQSPVNQSVFNWVCGATVGFNELDPAACALTVFSSGKQASDQFKGPVSLALAGILSGSPIINKALTEAAGDQALSKFSIVPDLMGMPLLALNIDVTDPQGKQNSPDTPWDDVLWTYDRRQEWAVDTGLANDTERDRDMVVRSREAESYNCLSVRHGTGLQDHRISCGGFVWSGQAGDRSNIQTYFTAAFSPEQEALLGCGPYFGTECDSNGVDLLWAEGSALLQSAVGNDSLGIDFETLGIAHLVPDAFGHAFMDNGSPAIEYRLDSRVIGSDGQLLRVGEDGTPELGSANGYYAGMVENLANGADGAPCDLRYEAFYEDSNGDGNNDLDAGTQNGRIVFAAQNRMNSRCWDYRPYYRVNGIQPGTAAFEIQQLGGPKCTTADIGGPEGQAGVLPGCRNKWAKIRYQPTATDEEVEAAGGYHPNNPLAGYVGNNYLGINGTIDGEQQRTDYRQLDLTATGWCPPGDADCQVRAPGIGDDQESGLNWGVFSPDAITGCDNVVGDRNRPDCYLGGWVQQVDGDPDRLGIARDTLTIDFPESFNATSGFNIPGQVLDVGGYGTIVQRDYLFHRTGTAGTAAGCTETQAWVWMQRVSDDFGGGYMNHPECAEIHLEKGAGHPFTGESFASEVGGLSFNFLMLLVAFSGEFSDGIASVRGFVNPEVYNGKLYSDQPLEVGDINYGNEANIDDELLPCLELPGEDCSRLQRDPELTNILDVLPDLKYYEVQSQWGREKPNKAKRLRLSASTGTGAGRIAQEMLYNESGKLFTQAATDPAYTEHWWRGLIRTMLWDYAYTGSENQLMALIPKCIDERVTQTRLIGNDLQYDNPARIDCQDGSEGETLGTERCTFVTPQHCSLVQALYSVAGQKRNIMRAGGNGTFGRRTMQWQSGGEVYLSYEKRNVLGFSMDFAEDVTKSNWSTEFTYISGLPTMDADSYEMNTRTDTYNLTVSVDRPTFINFLNANRTLFFNSQWFFQYRSNYSDGMGPNGPWNVLATFAVFTGYFQDRLNPSLVGVYDFRSRSGAALPSINYRFSEAFSITVGASIFFGRQQLTPMPTNGIAPAGERGGLNPYMNGTFGGVSLIKDRDEVFMTLRYTF